MEWGFSQNEEGCGESFLILRDTSGGVLGWSVIHIQCICIRGETFCHNYKDLCSFS